MPELHRVDARDKLLGRTRYIDDVNPPGVLHAAFVVSPAHRGRIRRVVLPPGFDQAAFTIVGSGDIPGVNLVPEPVSDEPFLAVDEALWRGQPILAVAHPDRDTARAFARAVQVVVDEEEAVTDPAIALDDESRVFGRELLIDHGTHEPPEERWLHLSRTYTTPHQEQAYLEPQGMLAEWDVDARHMRVTGSMQCPFFVKEAVEVILGDEVAEVSVCQAEGVGGAFGGKEDFPNVMAGTVALLAWRSGQPVKLVLERDDDLLITPKRHPSRITIESWTDRTSGRLRRLDIDYRLDAGACQTLSPVVLARGVLHVAGGYSCPAVRVRGRLFHSDTPPNGAFRGFGAPQGLFALEAHIDDIAAELSLDPATFRQRNVMHAADSFPTTQPVAEDNLADCLNELLSQCSYDSLRADIDTWNMAHRHKLGIGLSLGFHGGGYTGGGETRLASRVCITLHPDGAAEVLAANVEMGQGASTTLAVCAAQGLGLPLSRVRTAVPDTARVPNSGPTVASRTIYIVGNMLRRLGANIREELGDIDEWCEKAGDELPRTFEATYQPDPAATFDEDTYRGAAYRHYSWAACAAMVQVDADTSEVRIEKMWSVVDAGALVHPGIAMGQVYGGMTQACGWSLGEWWHKPGHGRLGSLTDYALPTAVDAPPFDVRFLHTDSDISKGLGELPMDYPAPAVRNAVLHATGIAIDDLPLLPERLAARLRKDNTSVC
ncbi:MAG: xanthine dehydrogenase family protein molybdopterin-binding subunit [Candidatus Cloacimonetes bacterium]|nr:xanthine dehydrogenase family protein molybdopterin-binding subunit [Candidatus Cloacimonadota bacterium]